MVERRPTDVDPGPKLRFAAAAIVFDLVSPRGLLNKLLLGLAAPVLPAVAVAFLRAAGDARGRTPAGPALDALAAPSRADVSLIVAESTVFCRRKKFVGAAVDEELWFVVDAVVEPVARLVGPVDALVALVPEAVAVVAASRVSPPDEARRPVFEEVADMERWTLRWPPAAALVEPVAVEPLEACDEEWPDEGTKEAGPEVAAADSARGVIPRNDNELPDRDPSLSKSVDLRPNNKYVANTSSYF